ncbi:MAG TPA: YqzL family protein [Clostridiales bacterium]|nr:YqzL family protein [Clostridiales bacterium]
MSSIDLLWKIFEKTGSLKVYLLYKMLSVVH